MDPAAGGVLAVLTAVRFRVRPLLGALLALAALVAGGCAPAAGGGAGGADTLWMPLASVRRTEVASNFGAPRGGGRRHEGQDFLAPRWTPVWSASYGRVERIGEVPLGGVTVWVRTPGGLVCYYAHLAGVAPGLRVGQRVTPDTLLGYVGDSGNARGGPPHLHFEIIAPWGPLEPLPYLHDRG